ncbi:UDP-N-acetylmuramoyl-L-alanine--D-glutamate ligase [Patescibacteria group bacterium]|nr:UDP-N-acetylmuramoyl-L-alanine--D-glutamate ligase [Patescibacteria group bacterium]MBU0964638.1 UDP-N-acetylmuramoyl-L-alanine--D-glutamate ligase [Patescibacteria group bacterium]
MKIDLKNLKNKKVTVMGLGLHGGGVSIVKWLSKQGASITITDMRSRSELYPSLKQLKSLKVKLVLGKHKQEDFKGVDLIIKNPGVPKESKFLSIAKKYKIPIETDISIFMQLTKALVIGVTGTKGKSTTSSLIYELLKAAKLNPILAGNIRKPPLDELNKVNKNTPVILELSSWQLEDIIQLKKSPNIAVVTNILPDHLNRYKSFPEYIKAKTLITKYQCHNDIAILNYQDKNVKQKFSKVKSKKYWFSANRHKKAGCFIKNDRIYFTEHKKNQFVCYTKDIMLPGSHNVSNALAAITIAKIFRLPNISIKIVLRHFKGIPNRLQFVGSWHGTKFYNDTTATTPEAAMAGIKCFNKKIILIGGGTDKKLNYNNLAKLIKKQVKFLVLFKGTASDKISEQLIKNKFRNWQWVKNMNEAVKIAKKNSTKQDIVLLSPGAASFGLFQNEFDRGDQFISNIKRLK